MGIEQGRESLGQSIRGEGYALLAALLREPPGKELLFQLGKIEVHPETPPPVADAWRKLSERSAGADAEAVSVEFASLFAGGGEGGLLPYASWYREGLLMSKPLAELRRDLSEFGIVRRNGQKEAEDHAALLFETMALLILQPGIGREERYRFFSRHLAPWMLDFLNDLDAAPGARYYRDVSFLGKEFLGWEMREKGGGHGGR
jgi:TorA maturation chaperone TorD